MALSSVESVDVVLFMKLPVSPLAVPRSINAFCDYSKYITIYFIVFRWRSTATAFVEDMYPQSLTSILCPDDPSLLLRLFSFIFV